MMYYEENEPYYELSQHHEELDEIINRVVKERYSKELSIFDKKADENKKLVHKNITLKKENEDLKRQLKSPFRDLQKIHNVFAVKKAWSGDRTYKVTCPICKGARIIKKEVDGEVFEKTCPHCSYGSISCSYIELELKTIEVVFDGFSLGNFGERVLILNEDKDKSYPKSYENLAKALPEKDWYFIDKVKANEAVKLKNEASLNAAKSNVNEKIENIRKYLK